MWVMKPSKLAVLADVQIILNTASTVFLTIIGAVRKWNVKKMASYVPSYEAIQ